MRTNIALSIWMAGTLAAVVAAVGCGNKKGDEATATTSTAAPATPPPATPAPGTTGTNGTATYPNMTPEGGTKSTLVPFTVHQAATNDSPVLSHIGVGTWINLKASYSNWMLIEWPSGVGQVSPGWIELRTNDARVTDHPDAGVPVVPDAGVAVVPDAGRTPIVLKPQITLPTAKPKGH